MKKWREVKKVEKLFKDGGFSGFKTFKISKKEKYTLTEAIGGHKTQSMYLVLDPSKRKEFLREMASSYEKAMNGRKYVEGERVTTIFYAHKS